MAGELTQATTMVGRQPIAALTGSSGAGGTAVVLVHGLGVSSRYWRPLARRLAAGRPVYAPDLPGHGRSAAPRRALDVPGLSRALEDWMTATGLPRAVLVGNSMGCQVAAELAARAPERVAALVLAGPTVDPAARSAPAQLLRLLLSAPVEHPAIHPLVVLDYARAGPRRILDELSHMLDHRIEELLPRVRAPALVLRGRLDRVVPGPWARTAAGLLPRGRLVEVTGGGHAVHFSRSDVVAEEVEGFLSEVSPDRTEG